MSDWQLKTPVAFFIFNRPHLTERVFLEIAKARPSKLLVVADGHRLDCAGEAEKVKAARAVIESVNWPCEVLTNFSEINLGCKIRVSSGLDWVFNEVEEAIILEDDCLPDESFFRFCQEMLERYRDDKRIGMVSGDNFQARTRSEKNSYYFSKYVHIWGWATWRNRWQDCYDASLSLWPLMKDEGYVADLVRDLDEIEYWTQIFDDVYKGKIDTWDYQWGFANWVQGRLCILPTSNLIANIGFGKDATHTVENHEFSNMTVSSLTFPLVHPVGVFANRRADIYTAKKCYGIKISFFRRALCRINFILRLV